MYNFTKICPVWAALVQAEKYADGHDEAKGRFSRVREGA
jgi:hypothetical protein